MLKAKKYLLSSSIWNMALENDSRIPNHALGEIISGHTTLFWKDICQQLPLLGDHEEFWIWRLL